MYVRTRTLVAVYPQIASIKRISQFVTISARAARGYRTYTNVYPWWTLEKRKQHSCCTSIRRRKLESRKNLAKSRGRAMHGNASKLIRHSGTYPIKVKACHPLSRANGGCPEQYSHCLNRYFKENLLEACIGRVEDAVL